MRLRRAATADIEALIAFPDDPALVSLPRAQVREDFEAGRMRPEWSWVLERDGQLVGRALWWGCGNTVPSALDAVDVLPGAGEPRAAALAMLRAGHDELAAHGLVGLPPCTLRLPGSWRSDAATQRAASWRLEAAAEAGLTEMLERLQYAWTPDGAAPATSTRATFRSGSDDEFVELFRQTARGSLDVETRRALEIMDDLSQAREDLEFYLGAPGERAWWRVALIDGEPVGFIIPSATPYSRNVGYLGVLPGHRGRGLVDDLLAEVTRFHAAAGAPRITATTDLANRPMAAALDRAGYRVTEVRLVLEAPRTRLTGS